MKQLLSKFKKTPGEEIAQYVGLSMFVGGLLVLAGFGWALLVAGVIVTGIGAGKEAGVL